MVVHGFRIVVAVLAPALCSGCTGQSKPESASSSPARSSALVPQSVAQALCEHALHAHVAASALSTVGDVRDFVVGGPAPLSPDLSRRPARSAFPTAGRSASAAWCTVATDNTLTFYAAGPDATAVKLETVNGYHGAVPDHPLAIP